MKRMKKRVIILGLGGGLAWSSVVWSSEDTPAEPASQDERATSSGVEGEQPASDEQDRLTELERQVQLLGEEIERLQLGQVAEEQPLEGRYGLAPSASKIYGVERGAAIGGYGEAVLQGFSDENDDGSASGRLNQFDFLRAIVYLGYKWNERFLFNSELEFEHAATDEGGSVSVEFAYVDFLYRPALNLRGGMVLVPMGFVNELHEPTVFYGSNRPQVETVIIPSTWRENGGGVFGEVGPVTYRSYLVAGLDSAGFSSGSGLRGGRQKGSRSLAEDFAWTGRLDLTGFPGFLVGGSFFIGGSGQGDITPTGASIDGAVHLLDVHAQYNFQGLQLRALYAASTVGDAELINESLGLTGNASIGSELAGWYLEAAYDFMGRGAFDSNWSVSPFVRYEEFDTQAKVPPGYSRNPANDRSVVTLGFEFQPLTSVVLKVDYQDYGNQAGTGTNQWNFAVGYQF
ncbi:MAG TPA: hypothetical protein VGC53_05200 [Vicinamibacteria bacterium]|jgi:hypothetical protein